MLEAIDSPATRFAQEAERRRIARELHDGVVQSLTALVADMEYFRTRRLSDKGALEQEVAAKLAAWQDLARDSLGAMRQTLKDLRGHSDLEFGLKASLQELLLEMRQAGYTVVYECNDWPAYLPFMYTSNLYYIVREALTNICKHAKASSISIFMFSHEGSLHISVGDNGVGTPAPTVVTGEQDGYHQGLIGLRERVTLLGGYLAIESQPGKGTRIDVEVPVPNW
ncbi:sensor histidine kinase [Ktedonosporobacter rubrisoli]|uniref:Oxygen sensor histidine kinase NreB n=1 Tax=Ktedonosporobacter rubrisoli TaxID=2509675 RepID=A0A4P6JUW8_KTERU|nr:sensor histidine kinase [Ktedonosporobacter rubrisoli]QBD79112.1 sensor histidine kinase [Ktedonosporobacter rubrisoli]